MTQPLLHIDNLSIHFAPNIPAVEGLSLQIAAGETFALLGESGCGKSLTALALMRLLPTGARIHSGTAHLGHTELFALPEAAMRQQRGGQMAMIFQEPGTSLNPVLTVGQQLGEVLARHRGLQGEAARAEAESLLALVGIADPAQRWSEYPFQFSGGMKQRVMIALALAGQPRLLIADEPTTALDVTVQAQILDLLQQLQAERQMGMLLITHDLGVVAQMAQQVGLMYAGELVEIAPKAAFFHTPRHPYAQALFAALPEEQVRGQRLLALDGQVPALGHMPPGCRFAPRCPFREARCEQEAPAWHTVGAQQVRCHRYEGATAQSAISCLSASPHISKPADISDAESSHAETKPTTANPVLQVDTLQVHFPIRSGFWRRMTGAVKAVDGVSLSLNAGKTLALVGESGCGKSTVGKAMLRLLDSYAQQRGTVAVAGQDWRQLPAAELRQARQHMQMVFQDPFASLNPRLRISEILSEGLLSLGGKTFLDPAQRGQRVSALLHQVGLPSDAGGRYPHEFSGGQRQRIAIARALAVLPKVLICDEPTSALDVSVQAQILNLLRQLQADLGVAYLFITHNFAVVEYLADEIAVMYLGRIVEQGKAEAILHQAQHPYTQALLAAIPRPLAYTQAQGEVALSPTKLPGEPPSPARPPNGCHFHPRCPKAAEICRSHYPANHQVSAATAHVVACHFPGHSPHTSVR